MSLRGSTLSSRGWNGALVIASTLLCTAQAVYAQIPPAPLLTPTAGAKCVSHAECGGNQLCIDYRCSVPPVPQAPAPAQPPPAALPPAPVAPIPAPVPTAPSPAAVPPPAPAAPTPGATAPAEGGDGLDLPNVIISSERLTGFGVWNVSTTNTTSGKTETVSGTSLALFIGTTSPDALPAVIYQTPRIALDYMFGNHFTVGTAAGIFVGSSSHADSTGKSSPGPALLMYEVAPRIGYLIPIGTRLAFWPRVGFTFYSFSQTNTSSSGQTSSMLVTGFGLNLEPTLVLRVAPHGGLTAFGVADIALVGSSSAQTTPSILASNFGLMFGGYVGF